MDERKTLDKRRGIKATGRWEKMRQARERHRMSQTEAAAVIGVTGATVSDWEMLHHAPLRCYWTPLAAYLDCTLDELAGEIATLFLCETRTTRRTRKPQPVH